MDLVPDELRLLIGLDLEPIPQLLLPGLLSPQQVS